MNNAKYNLLYSVYSLPNLFLPFLGGQFIDKIGLRKGVFLFSVVLIIGQLICALSPVVNAYYVMLFGRLIFGIGGENLAIT